MLCPCEVLPLSAASPSLPEGSWPHLDPSPSPHSMSLSCVPHAPESRPPGTLRLGCPSPNVQLLPNAVPQKRLGSSCPFQPASPQGLRPLPAGLCLLPPGPHLAHVDIREPPAVQPPTAPSALLDAELSPERAPHHPTPPASSLKWPRGSFSRLQSWTPRFCLPAARCPLGCHLRGRTWDTLSAPYKQ
ncbi:hypothetical protein GHT09_018157 [Marmota monax]|uniref:Uncharacterized protein n=1 Tax=Marmota monax TaxID=9995 RepID=A0A834PKH8_MARMO|nr:hypothetical protein GHT09_018157 [Marmota monax]